MSLGRHGIPAAPRLAGESHTRGRPAHFRADINGLRALAIIPVVAFHATVPGFGGGFIGVDVFFAISGFLITGNLLREVDRTGTVRLRTFWAARLRRLAPALSLMILLTLVAGVIVLSPLEWQALAQQAVASVFYVSNILFAVQSSDYFGNSVDQSLFLHTWTLGVEEQFYLVWPVLILGACWLAARCGFGARRVITVVFTLTLVGSFLLSLWQTEARPTWAFYLLPSRAWEFAAAGLLAAAGFHWVGSRRWLRAVLAALGLAALLTGVLLLTERVPFPGVAALLPVLGTLLLITAGLPGVGPRSTAVSRLLGTAPLQWIGTRSYSWYLWHWPVIVLTMAVFHSRSWLLGVAAGLASLGIAMLSNRFVETRVRYNRRLVASTRLTFSVMAASAGVVLVLSLGVSAGGGTDVAGAALAPFQSAIAARGVTDCTAATSPQSGIRFCRGGAPASKRTVMLVGDSHAEQWQNALSRAADAEGVTLVSRWLSACPAIPVSVTTAQNVTDPECGRFRADTSRLRSELNPAVVVVVDANSYLDRIVGDGGESLSTADRAARWATALESLVGEVRAGGAVAAVFEDNPQLAFDPNLCLTRLFGSEARCSPTVTDAMITTGVLRTAESTASAALGVAHRFGTVSRVCSSTRCRVLEGGTPIYADRGHLSAAWTLGQVAPLRDFLRGALAHTP